MELGPTAALHKEGKIFLSDIQSCTRFNIIQSENFQNPVDNHDISEQFDPNVHGFNGKVAVTLPGLLHPPVDSATLQAAQQLGSDFRFNLDMNSGTPLGIGSPSHI